jgi:hypothetical protein
MAGNAQPMSPNRPTVGLGEGAIGLAGLPGDARNAALNGVEWLHGLIVDRWPGVTPERATELKQNLHDAIELSVNATINGEKVANFSRTPTSREIRQASSKDWRVTLRRPRRENTPRQSGSSPRPHCSVQREASAICWAIYAGIDRRVPIVGPRPDRCLIVSTADQDSGAGLAHRNNPQMAGRLEPVPFPVGGGKRKTASAGWGLVRRSGCETTGSRPPPAPPSKQTAPTEQQARQSSTGDWTGTGKC